MTDVHSKDIRSKNMHAIKGKNTKPELWVRKFLFSHGFRYKLHDKELPGKPDIVLPRYKTVILINGCFWHGHNGCRYFVIPKTDTEKWTNKINKTILTDEKVKSALKLLNWNIIEIWECDLKKKDKKESTLLTLLHQLQAINPS